MKKEFFNNSYDDIINMEHHVSKKHMQMPLKDRAAQFAPFAALTGFDEEVNETVQKLQNTFENDGTKKENLEKFEE